MVGLERKDDLHAALGTVLIHRQQDMEVFDQLFSGFDLCNPTTSVSMTINGVDRSGTPRD